MRVALAAVLFAQPDLLLLDEPTNYLDLEGALWLESYLARYPHTVIIVSHDRDLLNRAVGAILHLEDRKLTLYQGSYDTFAATRAARLAVAEAEAQEAGGAPRPPAKLRRPLPRQGLEGDAGAVAAEDDREDEADQHARRKRRCAPSPSPSPRNCRRPSSTWKAPRVGYGGTPVLSKLNLRIDQDDRIALLGRNGEGKSTLSKLIAGKLAPMGGRVTRASQAAHRLFRPAPAGRAARRRDADRPHPPPAPRRKRPRKLRARLAGFGIGAEQADTEAGAALGRPEGAAVAAAGHASTRRIC